MTDQQIYDALGNINSLPTCSSWASGFAESVREQIKKGRTLSPRQKEVCARILKENSPEEVEKALNWADEYKTKHRDVAIKVATYYKHTQGGYFGDVVRDVLGGMVPVRRKYLKMVNNKYAKKVLVELARTPRFSETDHVVPNSKFTSGYSFQNGMMEPSNPGVARLVERNNFIKRGGIILGTDDKIKSAAKGAKRYLILPFGSINTYYVEERFLKKKPKVKKVKK